jgi:hypothetical protein
MGDNVSSPELMTESVELSEGMLGIIGAYGMRSALDVRDLRADAERPPERSIPSVAVEERGEGRPKANSPA